MILGTRLSPGSWSGSARESRSPSGADCAAAAPPSELGGNAHEPGYALRSGASRHRCLWLVAGADAWKLRSGSGHVASGRGGAGQAGFSPAKASPTVTSTTRPPPPRSCSCRSATPDGIPRHAGNRAPVQVGGTRFQISGRVCMDQFVIDVGDQAVVAGDTVAAVRRRPGR